MIQDSQFLFNLSVVIGHTIVYEQQNGFNIQACCSDPPAPTAQESTEAQLRGLSTGLPYFLNTVKQQAPGFEQSMFDISKLMAPQQTAANLDLYRQYGPQLNQVGADITKQNALSQAGADAAVLAGPGQDLIRQALSAQRQLDPEFFGTRENTGRQVNNLLNSIDVGGLSGSERSEIERNLNAQNVGRGTYNTPSRIETLKNANTFGSALETKRKSLEDALASATAFLPSSRSGVDAFQAATGRPSQPNPGAQQFQPFQNNAGQSTLGAATNIFNQAGENQRTAANINANRVGSFDRIMGSLNDTASACCFIFMEAYNGVLPDSVRVCRDVFYEEEPRVAQGYKRSAKYIVPLMKKSKLFRWFINTTMIKPLTRYSRYLVYGETQHKKYSIFKSIWFNFWKGCAD